MSVHIQQHSEVILLRGRLLEQFLDCIWQQRVMGIGSDLLRMCKHNSIGYTSSKTLGVVCAHSRVEQPDMTRSGALSGSSAFHTISICEILDLFTYHKPLVYFNCLVRGSGDGVFMWIGKFADIEILLEC